MLDVIVWLNAPFAKLDLFIKHYLKRKAAAYELLPVLLCLSAGKVAQTFGRYAAAQVIYQGIHTLLCSLGGQQSQAAAWSNGPGTLRYGTILLLQQYALALCLMRNSLCS